MMGYHPHILVSAGCVVCCIVQYRSDNNLVPGIQHSSAVVLLFEALAMFFGGLYVGAP